MAKKVVGFRLSDDVVGRIDGLAAHYGISRAAVVSLAVSRFWEQEGRPLPAQDFQGPDSQGFFLEEWDEGPDQEAIEVQSLLRERAKRERKKKKRRR